MLKRYGKEGKFLKKNETKGGRKNRLLRDSHEPFFNTEASRVA